MRQNGFLAGNRALSWSKMVRLECRFATLLRSPATIYWSAQEVRAGKCPFSSHFGHLARSAPKSAFCLVFMWYRASIAEIPPLWGGYRTSTLHALQGGNARKRGRGYRTQLAMLRHQRPIARNRGGFAEIVSRYRAIPL